MNQWRMAVAAGLVLVSAVCGRADPVVMIDPGSVIHGAIVEMGDQPFVLGGGCLCFSPSGDSAYPCECLPDPPSFDPSKVPHFAHDPAHGPALATAEEVAELRRQIAELRAELAPLLEAHRKAVEAAKEAESRCQTLNGNPNWQVCY